MSFVPRPPPLEGFSQSIGLGAGEGEFLQLTGPGAEQVRADFCIGQGSKQARVDFCNRQGLEQAREEGGFSHSKDLEQVRVDSRNRQW